jgi:hypothetical protein
MGLTLRNSHARSDDDIMALHCIRLQELKLSFKLAESFVNGLPSTSQPTLPPHRELLLDGGAQALSISTYFTTLDQCQKLEGSLSLLGMVLVERSVYHLSSSIFNPYSLALL